MPRDSFDPRSITDQLRKELRGHSFENMEDVQRHLDAQVRAYNTRPQEELGGLSPDQMMQLIHGDWVTTGALLVSDSLGPDDVGDPDTLHNARLVLATLRDDGPAKATAGGNLSRAFVGSLLDRFRFPPGYLEDVRLVNKVINEQDVIPLETLRYVLEFARLIHRRKGFHISPAGRTLLDDARRGELLALLFRTFFRVLDLRSLSRLDRGAGLQQTVGFTLWKIRSEAQDWTTPTHLADVAWLESARDPIRPEPLFDDASFRMWTFRHQVVDPLIGFGLLESRDLPSPHKWDRLIEVRRTPLFDRLLRFDFHRDSP